MAENVVNEFLWLVAVTDDYFYIFINWPSGNKLSPAIIFFKHAFFIFFKLR